MRCRRCQMCPAGARGEWGCGRWRGRVPPTRPSLLSQGEGWALTGGRQSGSGRPGCAGLWRRMCGRRGGCGPQPSGRPSRASRPSCSSGARIPPAHFRRSRRSVTSLGHVPRSLPAATSLGHIPRSHPLVTSLGHVPRSRPLILSLAPLSHVPQAGDCDAGGLLDKYPEAFPSP